MVMEVVEAKEKDTMNDHSKGNFPLDEEDKMYSPVHCTLLSIITT